VGAAGGMLPRKPALIRFEFPVLALSCPKIVEPAAGWKRPEAAISGHGVAGKQGC